jgi:hypothetical protein
VEGNLIGTDVTGTKSLGSGMGGVSVLIQPQDRFASGTVCNKAVGNRLGGTARGAGNVIAGSDGIGVLIEGVLRVGVTPLTCGSTPTVNRVEGNLIGTDVTGTKRTDAAGRSFGLTTGVLDDSGNGDVIGGTTGTTPGGPCAGACNVISGNAGSGVRLFGGHWCGCANIIQGNLIGTDITGTKDLGNAGDGIEVGDQNSDALRDTVVADNVVSGNGSRGVFVANGSSLSVVGNKIGTNATGTAAIPNDDDGVEWLSPGDGAIGGPTAGERNVISGNRRSGIVIDPFAGPVRIPNNYVGTTNAGAATLGNGGSGILIAGANDVHVGGTGAGDGNVIAGNGGDGVAVSPGVRNSILGNSIFRNGELGIDLGPDGVTGNDDGDGDGGANLLQNFPLITSAVGSTVSGTLNSVPGRTFRVEVFSNSGVAPCDSSGNGEGETFVGSTNVTTDVSGNQNFTVTLALPLPSGAAVTATATDRDGNTSEFSQCAAAQGVNKIVIRKQTRPSGSSQSFSFIPSYGSGFSLKDGEANTSATLPPGTYSVNETAVSGWDTTSSCGDGSPVTRISLGAGETVDCTFVNTQRGLAKVVKTVNGAAPGTLQSFVFELRQGASTTAAGTTLESASAAAGNGGVIAFATKLVPGTTYALCERVMPGWTTTLGLPFYVVYNASGDNSTVCTDFTVQAGETKTFGIDNRAPPGGLARTIGFWKNWASCSASKGNQKPVLDQTLAAAGSGITIGTLTLRSGDCVKAVRLLDKSTVDTGKKMASDPAFNLAAQLLAAKLNLVASAGSCGAATGAIADAQALLAAAHFNGISHDKLSNTQSTNANALATTLDRYNNNQLC